MKRPLSPLLDKWRAVPAEVRRFVYVETGYPPERLGVAVFEAGRIATQILKSAATSHGKPGRPRRAGR